MTYIYSVVVGILIYSIYIIHLSMRES